ncbi:dynamin family protein [Metabacillus sp. CT-WN-B3]|uniref:Dynamin family protein n=1 Tax=Metabacillus hrfriensis TaxID=3048891 RepID=A0ACD4R6X6_9BACI|nr:MULTISPECIES: dynamin family protein [Metabacillus]UAL50742.1 dynamin family protein [Metabacillus dongyingensis]USK27013.1 dynamin family protein [Bacillus sp. CMF21]WHZ56235.1 dynamin family protein [Metabacillus sp. CT-WN-B3]
MSTKTLKHHLLPRSAAVFEKVKEDKAAADKVKELIYKVHKETKHIAFTGHFSAGKSTMINTILEESILPTSPIPTSANVVLLQKGDKSVILHDSSGNLLKLNGEYSIQQVKDYCKQGEEIMKVEISDLYQALPENVVIMDTPGIDSTDAAHRMATESTLHLADLIFYVTDYNHVQSEENVTFISEMIHKGKNVYLIVNQIDKHREEEVSFSYFRSQIETTFGGAGLSKNHIFYTSLVDHENTHNQLQTVKKLIRDTIAEDHLVVQSAQSTLKSLVNEFLKWKEDDLEIKDIQAEELIQRLESVQVNREASASALQSLFDKVNSAVFDMKEQLQYILKNANLIPFETRSKAERYIAAAQPGFKVGLLFSKVKTMEERQKRESDLFDEITRHLQSQITWHLSELLKKKSAEYEIHDPVILNDIQSFDVKIQPQLLQDSIHKGATVNSQYTLTYSNDLSEAVKKECKQQVLPLIEEIEHHLKNQSADQIKALEKEVDEANKQLEELNETYHSLISFEQVKNDLSELMDQQSFPDINITEWLQKYPMKEPVEGVLEPHKPVSALRDELTEELPKHELHLDQDFFSMQIARASDAMRDIPGFHMLSASLLEKAQSLQNKSFTVALFGAFSAGKSSFANALLGEKLLPSSPTPTTATINKIVPVTADKPHGLIEVKFKSEEAFLTEIADLFSIEAESVHSALSKLNELEGGNERLKSLLPLYTHALKDFPSISGTVRAVEREEYKEFVANEEKACMVEEVIIYFDSPLTRNGITIVDTPGADSFNSRHTEVAFDYIKNADAILFVTYYNHPFSKGDREFLKQLGRVKDTFTMDKMFFVINAIDLAESKEEIEMVKEYITGQLLTHEIRHPRLYGISSLMELEKTSDPAISEFTQFQDDFMHFINNDLSASMIMSAKVELSIAKQQLQSILNAADDDQEKRKNELKRLSSERAEIVSMLRTDEHQLEQKQVLQEIKEQLFYVKQRTMLRFPDLFKESFHPGAFAGSSKQTKEILENCLQDLLVSLQFHVLQELQATTLRLEKYTHKLLENVFKRHSKEIALTNNELRTSMPEFTKFHTPKLQAALKDIKSAEIRQPLKKFKNTKSFFEKNEKKTMSDELQGKLDTPITDILSAHQDQFGEYYLEQFMNECSLLLENLANQAENYYEALLSAYTNNDLTLHQKGNLTLKQIMMELERDEQ